jgi:methylenetetrahydrofolate reductase (NADPH)
MTLPQNALKKESNLKKVLNKGLFAVTGELGPPRGGDANEVREKSRFLLGNVDAANITDNQTAVVRMSSLAASVIAQEEGLEANMQLVCRDRNRIALQSDLLGAFALGIRNVIALTGDHQLFGDHPESKNVFDLDSISLLRTIKTLSTEGKLLSGFELKGMGKPDFFIGAAFNPFADPPDFRVLRAGKKIEAGADFLMSQCIYDVQRFRSFMGKAHDMGLTERAYFMAGITPLKSLGMARYMKNHVPGIIMPDIYLKRFAGVPKDKHADLGISIAVEQLEELREIPGVAGAHLMFVEWEHMIPRVVREAKLLPRPKL